MSFQESLAALSRALGHRDPADDRRRNPRRPLEGKFTVLLEDRFGGIRPSLIEAVDVSDRGIAFRGEYEYAVGQKLLITDGEDVMEVVVRGKRREGSELVYGAELLQSAELPSKFVRKVPESFGRLAEEMKLDVDEVVGG